MSLMDRVDEWLSYAVSAAHHEGLSDEGLNELRGVRQALNGYVLVHRSHIVLSAKELHGRTDLRMDLQASTEGSVSMLQPFPEHVVPIVAEGMFTDLERYLEQPAPDPEQTQPDQP